MTRLSSQSWLIDKIESFIKKYYLNKIIKGTLFVISAIVIYCILLLLGEYFFYFKPMVKKMFLITLITIGVCIIGIYIIKPLLQLSKMSSRLTVQQAAKIIGLHFPDVQDKLINILELSSDDIPFASKELVLASIDQKSQSFKNISFTEAIVLKKNVKWVPWAAIPLLIMLVIYFINPKILNESSQRLLLVNQEFQKPAPFDILLLNDKLESLHFQDYLLRIKITGQEIPTEAFVIIDDQKISMLSLDDHEFSFLLKKIDQDTEFKIEAAGYQSQTYTIKVLKKPIISESKIVLTYPAYLGKDTETIFGMVDMTIPEGTHVSFEIKTQFSDHNIMLINEKQHEFSEDHSLKFIFKENSQYQYFYQNSVNQLRDSSQVFTVNVIKDTNPQLQISEVKDSVNKEQILLMGSASDDYGITKIHYTYKIIDPNGRVVKTMSQNIPVTSKNNVVISHYEDLKTYGLIPGQKVEYYIEAWDNDGVNGPKYTRSSMYTYNTVSIEKSQEELQQQNEEMAKSLAEGKDKLQELNKQLEKIKENNIQNKELNPWEAQQNLQLLEEHQQFIEKKLEEVQKRLEKQKDIQDNKEYNENIQEKQENIQKQLEQLKDKELSDQMKKLQELMNRKQENSMKMSDIDQMQMQNKLFDMSLERLEEMIKDLESQMMMEDIAKELDRLIDQQENLLEKTPAGDPNHLAKEQKNIQNQLDKLMTDDVQKLKEKADDKDFSQEEKLGEEATKDMEDSGDNLHQNNKSQSQKKQNHAIDKLKDMSQKMSQMANGMDMEQMEEDVRAVRQLLTNLLRLSFDQEGLINAMNDLKTSSPTYKDYIKKQHQLITNSVVIKDSLFALSKRVDKLGPMINKETLELEKRLRESVSQLENQQLHAASVNQQYAMTSANNLALVLNDLLGNLLQNMAMIPSQGSGKKSGQSKPGQSGPGSPGGQPGDSPGGVMKDIITGQQKIGKGMKELQSGQGQNQGKGQNGQSGEGGQSGQSGQGGSGSQGQESDTNGQAEQLSKLAYEQSMLRQQLQQLNSLLNSKGIKGNADLIRELQRNMDEIETALINRKVDHTLLRQQENILTRLLQAEDAIRQQEQDHKRQGKVGENKPRPVPAELQKYIDQQQKLKEYYKTAPPELKPFYKKLSEEYLKNLGQ